MAATARSAIARTDDLVVECLSSCSGRTSQEVEALARSLHEPLIDAPRSHAAVFGAQAAAAAGLPVRVVDPRSPRWTLLWRLYMKDRTLPPEIGVYEGLYASQLLKSRQ